MLRTLFFEYPEDRTSWLIDDEYLFGTDILVAPLMKSARSRDVYLPPGMWVDYQDGKTYEGARWHHIRAGEIPAVMLVRDGAAIPHAKLAQHTGAVDWREMELVVFRVRATRARAIFCLPEYDELHALNLVRRHDGFALEADPLRGRTRWEIRTLP
jgi:alpha-D-xyloside xylohydrolase